MFSNKYTFAENISEHLSFVGETFRTRGYFAPGDVSSYRDGLSHVISKVSFGQGDGLFK